MLPADNWETQKRGEFMFIYGKTDKGLVREKNEDAFIYEKISENLAFAIVCDGMGGQAGGEVASNKAIEFISNNLKNNLKAGMKNNSVRYLLESSISTANTIIFDMSNNMQELQGMGTTIVLAVINNNTLHIAHAGDSRAYLLRSDDLHRLTVDHSVVQTLVDNGELTEDQAKFHPNKNIITRALGANKDIAADLSEVYLQQDDILLLCTDGLSNLVEVDNIKLILKEDIALAPEKLIQIANNAGGYDNITAVVLCV